MTKFVAAFLYGLASFTAAPKAVAAGTPVAQAVPESGVSSATAAAASSIMVHGRSLSYEALTGTIAVQTDGSARISASGPQHLAVTMGYTAYFHKNPSRVRPLLFLYNGGPGSATTWLHIGAFGPWRVRTADAVHTPAAPYDLAPNEDTLLDVADLVFIDAPGTGLSRCRTEEDCKAFHGTDQDANAFRSFIKGFLTQYARWNSPKFLFGESYGTLRTAILANRLQVKDGIDLNGIILLSQVLSLDLDATRDPRNNPGNDLGYILALPSYAATAWYHQRLTARPAVLTDFLAEVERFALTDYASVLIAGARADPNAVERVAQRVADYTGLSEAYVKSANLRISAGMFEKALLLDKGLTVGELDTRFSGPNLDALSRESEYDPQASALTSAHITSFNQYLVDKLHYRPEAEYRSYVPVLADWDFRHTPPGGTGPSMGVANAMPDLADTMKRNPSLKVLVAGGYFDVASPYFQGRYEMDHLQVPEQLKTNINFRYYASGHMVYANDEALRLFHRDVAAFIVENSAR